MRVTNTKARLNRGGPLHFSPMQVRYGCSQLRSFFAFPSGGPETFWSDFSEGRGMTETKKHPNGGGLSLSYLSSRCDVGALALRAFTSIDLDIEIKSILHAR